jgi:hypothetical protein
VPLLSTEKEEVRGESRRISTYWFLKEIFVQQPLGQAQGIAQAAEGCEHEDR